MCARLLLPANSRVLTSMDEIYEKKEIVFRVD